MVNKILEVFAFIFCLYSLLLSAEPDKILLSDSFDELTEAWTPITLNGDEQGKSAVENGNLIISGSDSYSGIYHEKTVSGHFIVDLEFKNDQNIGLALVKSKNGKPDTDNYTLLTVNNRNGNVTVQVKDRQHGKSNVLDHTGKTDFEGQRRNSRESELNICPDLYKHVLTGNKYSMPFNETNKTIRIFREDNADFFHYYYQVSKNYLGEKNVDWIELRPSPDWTAAGSEFFIALVSLHKGQTIIKNVRAVQKPVKDRKDIKTGFKVTKREYNWSGFIGDAYVVTFDEAFQFHEQDKKFVFWTEMNYIPAWHLNNQLLYTYEFAETWDDQVPGCHEPMSDRLLQWSDVKVLEDNPVRKVLKWHYVLCNPNYKYPHYWEGKQLPEVDEYWTFYPDGSGTRRIEYKPKLDTEFRAPHELGELISLAGSKAHSSDFYNSPALTLMNLDGEIKQAHPGPKFDYYSEIDDWDQQILAVHFQEEPDVFCAWSDDPEIPETFSGYQIRFENAWQNPNGEIVHWPVNKRPYTSAYASGGTWQAEVSHACLISWGVRDGIDWEDNFKIDETGRKYREWVSLVGLNNPGATETMKNKTATWLFKGDIHSMDKSVELLLKDYKENSFVLQPAESVEEITFKFVLDREKSSIINPVFRIKNWGDQTSIKIFVDGKEINYDQFVHDAAECDMLIWLNQELESENTVRLISR